MRLRAIQFVLLFPALFLGACATSIPVHEYLPPAAKDKISSTDVVVPIQQSEIYVFVPISTAGATAGGGFGILGAVVGAMVDAGVNDARAKNAETAVKPLRNALIDYKFDDILQGEINTSVSQLAWMHAGDARIVKEVKNDSLDRVLAGSKADAILIATTDYHLMNDGDVLYITVGTSLFPNNDALRALIQSGKHKADFKSALVNAVYRNSLVFQAKVPNATSDRDHNIAIWSADNGAAMRASLKLGAAKLVQMLAEDLQRVKVDGEHVTGGKGSATVDGSIGDVVRSDADGSLMRFGDGTLKFVAK